MTAIDLRTYLKAWAVQVLNTEQGMGLIIISSHQNAPAPDQRYITIDYSSGRTPIGRATKGDTQDDGTRLLVDDHGLTIEIRETNGEGDALVELAKSIERDDIQATYFCANGIAHYKTGNIVPIPRLEADAWIKESMVELELGIAESTRETTSYLETVDYSSEIGGNE